MQSNSFESGMPGKDPGETATPERYEAIILGAGISGLVSASILLSQGCRRILIADAYSHLGGNHIDWSKGGLYLRRRQLHFPGRLAFAQALPGVGPVAGLVGIEGGVVSEVINLESSGVGAPDRRPRHEQQYHEVGCPAV
jgi:putative NAD(P)-binding protein